MKPRVTVITVGVDDLERSLRFYRDGLGLETEGIIGKEFEHGAVAFFDLQAGLKLAIWPRTSISHDSGIPLSSPSPTELTVGHNVSSKAEVDAVMEQAQNAGAIIVKPAHDTFWGGYAGYFQDPDQHLWEIVWNPQWAIRDGATGNIGTDSGITTACSRRRKAARLMPSVESSPHVAAIEKPAT